MFYKIQFPDLQAEQLRRLAADMAELQEYAQKPGVNPNSITIRQSKLENRAGYLNFVAELVNELEIEINRARHQGYKEGRTAEYLSFYPQPVTGTPEQRRATNINNAIQKWPELY